jgi:hypothetical protein
VVLDFRPVVPANSAQKADAESDAATDPDIESDFEMVRIYESSHPAVIALAESILESSKIPFIKQGRAMLDLYGWGPVAFLVRAKDEDAARALLADLYEADLDTSAFEPGREDKQLLEPAHGDEADALPPERPPAPADTPASGPRPRPIPRLDPERQGGLSLTVRRTGGFGVVVGFVVLAWALPRFATLTLPEQLGVLLPLVYSLAMLKAGTFENWHAASGFSRIEAVAAVALAMLLTSACLFYLLTALYARPATVDGGMQAAGVTPPPASPPAPSR